MSLDDLQAQLRGALDQQFAVLKQQYEYSIEAARRDGAAEAGQKAAAELALARQAWDSHTAELVAAARAEAAQTAEAANAGHQARERQLQQQFEQHLDETRERAARELAAAADRARADAEAERARTDAQLEAERRRADEAAERAAEAPVIPAAAVGGVAEDVRALDRALTLSQSLDTLLSRVARPAARAVLLLIDGERLKVWNTSGISRADVQSLESPIGQDGLLAAAIHSGRAALSSPDRPAPPIAGLPAGRAAIAVPLTIDRRPVAVLYADVDQPAASAGAFGAIELLVRHASVLVALRTAVRTLDLCDGVAAVGDRELGSGPLNDDRGARRFARLLVSEIKLYNEAAVRAGREQQDLLQRLGPEIGRARRLYEERVPPAAGARHAFFHQELVQTLAGGDPSLLGSA